MRKDRIKSSKIVFAGNSSGAPARVGIETGITRQYPWPNNDADLIVIDRNLFTFPPSKTSYTEVTMTLFDGRVVYE